MGESMGNNNSYYIEKIHRLKKSRNAVIVAHSYQNGEIQDIADIVGDSYALSKYCASQKKDIIVFCGVNFMAESAKILAPEKTVLLPERNAGCPMADMINAESLRAKKAEYPKAVTVTYINSSAEVKAESDVCVTSSNALKVVKNIKEKEILFTPDKNLGTWVASHCPEKNIILWNGYCPTHNKIKNTEVQKARELHPDAILLVHPECTPDVVQMADFVGSTKDIIDYAKKSDKKTFMIGTEMGVLHALEKQNSGKKFYLLGAGLMCPNMKMTTLKSVCDSLEQNIYEINVPPDIAVKAKKMLDNMLELAETK
ncbi:MAG: quinolinate synthase NadA [Clostridiales bacterium]|jgi:quinolinate synthase|nr:quinolinate synthase NadA [Clostridiales bacterium]